MYLPACTPFKNAFLWRTEQKFVRDKIIKYETATRIKTIYYVIDGDPDIYTSTYALKFLTTLPLPDLPAAVVPNSPGAVRAIPGPQSTLPSLTQTPSRGRVTGTFDHEICLHARCRCFFKNACHLSADPIHRTH